ncbi:Uncharacterized protein dnm_077180 [Desulfonema magnum]|uniref:Uncharacterized protein n=1 Tax=Desulfonema magnum TaxID=45655 RepID=A0A975BV08_9BACT|nr:Uncharacterized protein dnm_077180 [Desulfonema magnum]
MKAEFTRNSARTHSFHGVTTPLFFKKSASGLFFRYFTISLVLSKFLLANLGKNRLKNGKL